MNKGTRVALTLVACALVAVTLPWLAGMFGANSTTLARLAFGLSAYAILLVVVPWAPTPRTLQTPNRLMIQVIPGAIAVLSGCFAAYAFRRALPAQEHTGSGADDRILNLLLHSELRWLLALLIVPLVAYLAGMITQKVILANYALKLPWGAEVPSLSEDLQVRRDLLMMQEELSERVTENRADLEEMVGTLAASLERALQELKTKDELADSEATDRSPDGNDGATRMSWWARNVASRFK